jgi:hypothetical protein
VWRHSAKLFAALIVPISTNVVAQTVDEQTPELLAWRACVFDRAERYAATDEDAVSAGRIAVNACSPEREAYFSFLVDAKFSEPFYLIGRLEELFADQAAAIILDLRSR